MRMATTSIGEQVRAYRLRRGLTQLGLAQAVGRSERWLLDVERGDVDPRLSDALALARALRVSMDELVRQPFPVLDQRGPRVRPPGRTRVRS